MGDVVMRSRSSGWQRWSASAAAVTVAVVLGCAAASTPARIVEASPSAMPEPSAATKAEARTAQSAAEIRSLDVREGAPEVFVDLEASAPLVWTSFRNADGRVVVELPNAVPGPSVKDVAPEDGLVSSLTVQRSDEGSRPLTRLVIGTRQDVEHSVTADGTKLHIQLLPVEKAKLAFEPLSEEPAAAPAASSPGATGAAPAEPVQAGGTPERPMVAPAPAGPAATRLDSVEVLAATGGAVIRIAGDGEFPYSTFALSEPRRFVIDLQGVVNRSPRNTLSVEGSVVERVRVAQFKPAPKAISRVVFDLRRDSLPTIERTGDGLVVSFPAGDGVTPAEPVASRPAPAATMASAAPPSGPMAAQPSDLALAQRQPPASGGRAPRIESEDAEDTPAPVQVAQAAPSTAPPSVKVTPSKVTASPPSAPGSASSVASPSKVQTPIGRPVDVSSPTTPLRERSLGNAQDRPYFGEPIDLKVTNADVTDVLRTFAQISGLNIIVQPGVNGVVTAELENVPWDQALEQVLKINNLDYELDGNVMRIAPTKVLRDEAQERQELARAKSLAIPLRTVYQRLSYANADQVAVLLKSGISSILSQRGSVVVDRRTNGLIIKELPTNMDAVLSVIDLLDSPEPQVMIEARIIETTKRFTRELGINWGFDAISDAAHGNTTGLIFPNNGEVSGGVNLGGSGTNGTIGLRLGNVLNTFQLDVALQAAESDGLITILSAPKVATLNNQRATIQSGLEIPIQTIFNGTISVQFVNATLRLDVVPQITAEGTIMMDVAISKREPQVAFLLPGAVNVPIATKDARTRLVVRDGGTAVIGGIYRVAGDNSENRVPGLANIPIIGHLFKGKARREENDELLIFITPRVIKI